MSRTDASTETGLPGQTGLPGRKGLLRWVAPVAVAALAVAGPLAATRASAEPALPEKSAEELLTAVASAEVDGLSGTVQQSAELGLPSLPSSGHGSEGIDPTELLTGDHTLSVWAAGEDKAKVAMHEEYGEATVVRNGNEAWLWSSQEKKAVHTTYTGKHGQADKDALPATPQEAAEQALDAVDDSTDVTVARNVEVAGRAAYELVLTPTDDRSLVSEVTIAIDGKTSVPLRVQVAADGQSEPAFSVGFSKIDFSVPDDSTFEFSPPSGAKVENHEIDGKHEKSDKGDRPDIVGEGWTSVAVLDEAPEQQDNEMLQALPKVSGSWGSGRLLTGNLFSVVITDDGRTAAGAVEPELLYAALDE